MTATTVTSPAPSAQRTAPLTRRLWAVVRLHVASPRQMLVLPPLITLGILGVNYSVWRMIATAAGGVDQLEPGAFAYNGGVTWIYVYLMVAAIGAMNASFRFAMGVSMTRRDYYLGTSVFYVLISIGYALLLTLGAVIERATNGWGLEGWFFAPFLFDVDNFAQLALVHALGMVFFTFFGTIAAAVWVRWRSTGLVTMIFTIIVGVVAAMWGVTVTDQWGAVGRALSASSALSMALWSIVPSIVFAVAGYLLLRRATVRA